MQTISKAQRRKGTAGQMGTMFAKRLALKGVLVDRNKDKTVKKKRLPTVAAPKGLR